MSQRTSIILLLLAALVFLGFGCTRDPGTPAGDAPKDDTNSDVVPVANEGGDTMGSAVEFETIHDGGRHEPTVRLEKGFSGLTDQEVLTVESTQTGGGGGSRRDYVLRLASESATRPRNVFGEIELVSSMGPGIISRDSVIFNHYEGISDNGHDPVWTFDAKNLTLQNTGLVSGRAKAVTDDGRFFCFEHPTYVYNFESASTGKEVTLYIPVIKMHDFQIGQTHEFDLTNGMLEEAWGVTTEIEYVPKDETFVVTFSIDAPGNVGQVKIDPNTLEMRKTSE